MTNVASAEAPTPSASPSPLATSPETEMQPMNDTVSAPSGSGEPFPSSGGRVPAASRNSSMIMAPEDAGDTARRRIPIGPRSSGGSAGSSSNHRRRHSRPDTRAASSASRPHVNDAEEEEGEDADVEAGNSLSSRSRYSVHHPNPSSSRGAANASGSGSGTSPGQIEASTSLESIDLSNPPPTMGGGDSRPSLRRQSRSISEAGGNDDLPPSVTSSTNSRKTEIKIAQDFNDTLPGHIHTYIDELGRVQHYMFYDTEGQAFGDANGFVDDVAVARAVEGLRGDAPPPGPRPRSSRLITSARDSLESANRASPRRTRQSSLLSGGGVIPPPPPPPLLESRRSTQWSRSRAVAVTAVDTMFNPALRNTARQDAPPPPPPLAVMKIFFLSIPLHFRRHELESILDRNLSWWEIGLSVGLATISAGLAIRMLSFYDFIPTQILFCISVTW